jgi:hypothetical protein
MERQTPESFPRFSSFISPISGMGNSFCQEKHITPTGGEELFTPSTIRNSTISENSGSSSKKLSFWDSESPEFGSRTSDDFLYRNLTKPSNSQRQSEFYRKGEKAGNYIRYTDSNKENMCGYSHPLIEEYKKIYASSPRAALTELDQNQTTMMDMGRPSFPRFGIRQQNELQAIRKTKKQLKFKNLHNFQIDRKKLPM